MFKEGLADTCGPDTCGQNGLAPMVIKLLWHCLWYIIEHKISYKVKTKVLAKVNIHRIMAKKPL
jgi:hypothetical protein